MCRHRNVIQFPSTITSARSSQGPVMKSVSKSAVVSLVVSLSYCVPYVSSILCYDCNSAYDPRCGVEFDSFSLGIVNCSLRDPPEHLEPIEPSYCRSIKMDIYGKVRVVRQCAYLAEEEIKLPHCRRVSGNGDVFVTYCTCNTDLCNSGAEQIYPQMALLSVFLFLVVWY